MEGTFGWFSWLVSLGLTAWVVLDAKRRGDDRVGLWGFLAFFFPWVVGPLYWAVFVRKAPKQVPASGGKPGRKSGEVTRRGPAHPAPGKDFEEQQIAEMAAQIARAGTASARAGMIRMVGRTWADHVSADVKAGGLASVRVLIEATAEAVAKGDVAKAQEQMDKALSHVHGKARRHPGGRMILAGLAELAKERPGSIPLPEAAATAPDAAPDVRQVEASRRAAEVEKAARPAPEPAATVYDLPADAPPAAADAGPTDAVPAFLAARPAAAPAPTPPAPAAPPPAYVPPTYVPPVYVAPEPLPTRVRAPGEEPLDAYAVRVAALATRWLADVAERAPGMERSYARVKLESAASAVFRGDFRRACEMADAAAELVPADVPAAVDLRAQLRRSLEEPAAV